MEKNLYKLLALSLIFMGVGAFFFFNDYSKKEKNVETNFQSGKSGRTIIDPALKDFPTPEKYQNFSYYEKEFNKKKEFSLTATCADEYIAVLVFPISLDYREDITKAVMNKAFSCGKGISFSYALSNIDLPQNLASGDYYVILADQGSGGTWYNPR